MNTLREITKTAGLGLLVIAPVYLTLLLLLKGLASLKALLAPVSALLPEGLQNDALLALLLLFVMSLLIGGLLKTVIGQTLSDKLEKVIYERIPGYRTFRSLTRRLAGDELESTWRPALVQTDDDALMPVFVVEELPDGRYTVFVPSVPTPLAGAVFIYPRERVQLVDMPFRQALGVVTRWGEGAKDLVAAAREPYQA